MTPLIRVTRGLSAQWFVRRWHAGQEFTAWQHRRAWAGATVSCGWWRVSVALLRRRNKAAVRVSPRWADQLTADPDDDRDRRGRRRWSR